MDHRQNIEMFATSYPKGKTSPVTTMRTPLREVVSTVSQEGFHPSAKVFKPANSSNEGIKKFLSILLITILGALFFSTFAYTLSDNVSEKMGIQLFDENGSPSMTIIVVHALLFFISIYVILGAFK